MYPLLPKRFPSPLKRFWFRTLLGGLILVGAILASLISLGGLGTTQTTFAASKTDYIVTEVPITLSVNGTTWVVGQERMWYSPAHQTNYGQTLATPIRVDGQLITLNTVESRLHRLSGPNGGDTTSNWLLTTRDTITSDPLYSPINKAQACGTVSGYVGNQLSLSAVFCTTPI